VRRAIINRLPLNQLQLPLRTTRGERRPIRNPLIPQVVATRFGEHPMRKPLRLNL
jgi:hypothetical protein